MFFMRQFLPGPSELQSTKRSEIKSNQLFLQYLLNVKKGEISYFSVHQ